MKDKFSLKNSWKYIVKILSYFNFLMFVSSLILFILMSIFFFNDSDKILEKTKLNYDYSVTSPKLKPYNLNIDKLKEEFKINSFANLTLNTGLAIKDEKDNFKTNIITITENNLNLLNTDTLDKNKINIEKEIAKIHNIKNDEKIFIKQAKFKDIDGLTNTNFNQKHPLFIDTTSVVIYNDINKINQYKTNQNKIEEEKTNNKKEDLNSQNQINIFYFNLPDEANKETLVKIKSEILKENKDLIVQSNPYDAAKFIKPIFEKSLTIQILIFMVTYTLIKYINLKIYKKDLIKYLKDVKNKDKKVIRKIQKEEKSIKKILLKVLIQVINIIFLAYLGFEVFRTFTNKYLFNFGIYIKEENKQLLISFISVTIIVILNIIITNLFKRRIKKNNKI